MTNVPRSRGHRVGTGGRERRTARSDAELRAEGRGGGVKPDILKSSVGEPGRLQAGYIVAASNLSS